MGKMSDNFIGYDCLEESLIYYQVYHPLRMYFWIRDYLKHEFGISSSAFWMG